MAVPTAETGDLLGSTLNPGTWPRPAALRAANGSGSRNRLWAMRRKTSQWS